MATTLTSTITSMIQKVYGFKLAETFINTAPAYARLKDLGRVETDDHLYLRWPCVSDPYGGETNIIDGETLPDSDQEEYSDAELEWKIVIAMIRLGRVLQRGTNPEEYFRTTEGATVLARQSNAAIGRLARRLHSQIIALTTASTKNITSIGDGVANNSNTYANIARAGATYWQPYVNDNSGTNRSLTEALMRDMYDTLTDDRGSMITEIWAGTTAWNALTDLLDDIARRQGTEELRGGTLRQFWNGIPVVRMPNMDANAMFWLDMESDDGIVLKKQHNEDFIVREESTSSYDNRWSIAGHYQLVVHNPFRQGSLLDVQ